MTVKHELQNIISGNGSVRHGKIIQSITGYLKRKKKAVSRCKEGEFNKDKEVRILKSFIADSNFWHFNIDSTKYIGEGVEQKIFEFSDPNYVLKLNNSIYYTFWEDYFNNLLVHNYFFPHLSYELLGFHQIENNLFAAVKQPFVKSTENTNLQNVKEFLSGNGFVNKKENDYYHPDLGIILEDLHEENVLTSDGILQFIDTVFFLTDKFYMQ